MADSQMSDRQLLELISKKISVMDEKLNSIVGRIDKVENEVSELQTHVEELDRGISFIQTEFQEQKSKIDKFGEEFVTKKEIDSIKKEVIDSSNRSRRNNIVLYNVPEGEESEIGCAEYVTKFLKETIGMDPVPDIEVAHRSGKRYQQNEDENGTQSSGYPRRIHARCFRRPDRDTILESAAKVLKDKDINIFITDDIHSYTREVHKELVTVMKDMRSKNWFDYIPWSMPRVIKYRNTPPGTRGQLNTYRLKRGITAW